VHTTLQVLPKLKELAPEQQLKVLKLFADIAPFIKGAPCRTCLPHIWLLALSEVPDTITAETKINWAALECLLYTFHQLASCVPGFMHSITGLKIFTGQPENKIDEDHTTKLAELTTKMTTLVKQSADYVKKLQQVMQKLREGKLDTPEAKKENGQKIASCQTTIVACQNVSILAERIKSINLKDPNFLADEKAVKLSFKQQQSGGAGGKRKGGAGGGGEQGGMRGGMRGGVQPAVKRQANAGANPNEKAVYHQQGQGQGGGGKGGGGKGAGVKGGRGGMVMRGASRGGRGMRGRGGRR